MKIDFEGIYEERKGNRSNIFTKNLVPGRKVYDERLVKDKEGEFREWNPRKSKLGAAITKGVKEIGIKLGSKVLYLGASTGTTPSHISDIVGPEGFIFALDFSPRTTRELVFLCEERKNMTPMLYDANQPKLYKDKVLAPVDIIYQDIAQRNQAEIFLKNVEMFLKKGGIGLLAVKARSVDVTKRPGQIYDMVKAQLEKELTIIDSVKLDPFEKDHCMFICKKR